MNDPRLVPEARISAWRSLSIDRMQLGTIESTTIRLLLFRNKPGLQIHSEAKPSYCFISKTDRGTGQLLRGRNYAQPKPLIVYFVLNGIVACKGPIDGYSDRKQVSVADAYLICSS